MAQLVVFISCLAVFAGHVALAVYSGEAAWASRSGSAIVAVGLLLESWKLLTTPRADDMPMWSSPEGHSAIRASVVIIIVGTLIQGYADLTFRCLFGTLNAP